MENMEPRHHRRRPTKRPIECNHPAVQSYLRAEPHHAPPASPPSSRVLAIIPVMSTPDETKHRQQLVAEGFSNTFVWQDRPGAYYSDHTHVDLTAHIILDGEMTLTMNG